MAPLPTRIEDGGEDLPPLIRALSRGLTSLPQPQCLYDCLRLTKKIPSQQVTRAMASKDLVLDNTTIRVAYGSLLTGPLYRIPRSTLGESKQQGHQPTTTTLHVVEDLILIFNFLQLLLELNGKTSMANGKENNAQDSSQGSVGTAKDAHVHEVVGQVIKGVAGVICGILESGKDLSNTGECLGDDDDTFEDQIQNIDVGSSMHPLHAAWFTLQNLLRLTNAYIAQHPRFLSTIWRGLSDISSNCNPLPQALMLQSLKSLLMFLKEGSFRTIGYLQEQSRMQKSPAVKYLKIVAFLLSRVQYFLHKLRGNNSHPTVTELMENVSFWVGVEFVIAGNDTKVVAEKAQKCVHAFLDGDDDSRDDREALFVESTQLTKTPAWLADAAGNNPAFTKDLRDVCVVSTAFGKALVVVEIMKATLSKASAGPKVAEALMKQLRSILFYNLPTCFTLNQGLALDSDIFDGFLAQILPSLVEAFVFALAGTGQQDRQRVFHLSISWLALSSKHHPLSSELVKLMFVHAISTEKVNDLCHFLVQLLFDERTTRILRAPVAHVLRRAMVYLRLRKSENAVPLENMIAQEVKKIVQQWMPSPEEGTKKRKRSRKKLHVGSSGLSACDLQIVGHVLLLVDSDKLNFFQGPSALSEFMTSESYDLRLAALGSYCNQARGSFPQLLKNCSSFLKSHGTSKVVEALAFSMLAERASHRTMMENDECKHLLSVASRILAKQHFGPDLKLAVVRVLGMLGKVLPNKTPGKELTSSLSQLYKQVLPASSPSMTDHQWPLHSYGLTAFTAFIYKAPNCYSDVLQACRPSDSHIMTSRLKRKLYLTTGTLSKHERHGYQRSIRQKVGHRFETLIPVNIGQSTVFSTLSTLSIAPRSHVLTLPFSNDDGEERKATVIFDPTESSINDIVQLLAAGDKTEVFELKGCQTTNDGNINLRLQSVGKFEGVE